MYLSNGYIHLKYTGPHSFTSRTKCTVRWIMMSKKEGGKYFSSKHNVLTNSDCSKSSVNGSITLEHIELKNEHNLVIANLTSFVETTRKASSNNYYIKIWQSYVFIPISLKSFIDTNLLKLEVYPLDTFTEANHSQNFLFSCLDNAFIPPFRSF